MADEAKVPTVKVDITNPLPMTRVIHDHKLRRIKIDPGQTVLGVELIQPEADRLKNVHRVTKGQELQLRPSTAKEEYAPPTTEYPPGQSPNELAVKAEQDAADAKTDAAASKKR